MPRATTRKTRPAPSAAPLVTRRRAADLREEKKSKEQVVKAVQEKRAPISEVTKFVPVRLPTSPVICTSALPSADRALQLAPGNKVRVQVGKEKVWVDGVVTKFFGPLPMKLDETQVCMYAAGVLCH